MEPPLAVTTTALPPARLLVVDDEQRQVLALSELLQAEGYAVRGTTDPAEALRLLAQSPADLLLTDLQMPEMDGMALLSRALEIDPDLVPLLMTGHGTVEAAVEAMKCGAIDFVLKPFRLSALRPVLARALEIRQLRLNARALGERLAERSAQLEAANRELDAFAARVAHDLQGPVQNMIAYAQLIQAAGATADHDEAAHLVDRLVASGARADTMIRDLLAFARLGHGPLARAPASLGALVQQARAALPQAPGAAAVDWVVAEELPTVNCDASLLLQVLLNLLSNAVKYCAPRTQPRIEIGARALPGGGHEVWVADNGVGFDATQAHRLFAPFERLHGLSEFPGTGMGLANVKRIVERHGGEVFAESPAAGGARFGFTLPA